MRSLFVAPAPAPDLPEPSEPDLVRRRYVDVDRAPTAGRPWVLLNMVASIDGAITDPEGRSGGLSSPADKAIFHALREAADVILVGAATVRAERYGPIRLDDAARERRRRRGVAEVPRLAIVTGSLDLGAEPRLFDDPTQRPIVVTSERSAAAASDAGRLDDRLDVVAAGTDGVDLAGALRQLHDADHRVVLCEGGAVLNGGLWAADAVDEVCLAVSPVLAGGAGSRILVSGPRGGSGSDGPSGLSAMTLAHVVEDGDFLFLRYVRSG